MTVKRITEAMVIGYIRRHPGCTQKQIATAFPTGSKLYGSHKFVSAVVARLREKGLVPDVPRCKVCKRALTRGHQNTRLYLNDEID